MTETFPQPEWFSAALAATPIMVVLRGAAPDETVRLCEIAWAAGVTEAEVPIETPAALPALRAVVAVGHAYGRRVGAGTITTPEQLHAAVQAGADYAVSPGLDPELVAEAHRHGLPFLPGIATPSEILQARKLGLSWLKAFPASNLGTGWFRAMRGPFPDIHLVATGGMNGANAANFLAAGAEVIGTGSSFADPAQLVQLTQILGRPPSKGTAAPHA